MRKNLHRVFVVRGKFCIHHSAFFVCPRAYKKTTRGEGWSFHPIAARGAGISRKRQSQSGTVQPDNAYCSISAFFRQSLVSKINGTVSRIQMVRARCCAPVQIVKEPQSSKALSLRGRRPWQSVSPKPSGFDRTTGKMVAFKRTDCHVGLRPPRNDVLF